ncbi:MAG: DEAD/DEAH box helicase family protein [Mycoplasmataceae bacterium]|nr:DEAD/DEAH box helicase family protein [Mycoplasmataceae bacterium]
MEDSFGYIKNESGSLLRNLKRLLRNSPREYNFSTAYFDFAILREYFETLDLAIKQGCKVKFLISQGVNTQEFLKIKSGSEKHFTEFHSMLKGSFSNEEIDSLFSWISNGDIQFKVAFLVQGRGIVHTKLGFVKYQDRITEWHGSANHTYNGMAEVNVEQVSFNTLELEEKSWVENSFDSMWNNKNPKVISIDISAVLLLELSNKGEEIPPLKMEWFSEKIDNFLIIEDGILYVKTSVTSAYFMPPGVTDAWEYGFKSNEFNGIAILNWLKNNPGYYAPSETMMILNDTKDRMMKLVYLGQKIRENKFSDSDEFFDFKNHCKELKRIPFEQQYKQAFFAYEMKKSLNFSVPGTGKTMVSLMTFHALRNEGLVKTLLVAGPTASHSTWEEEYFLTFGKHPKILNLSKLKLPFDEKYRTISNLNKSDYDLVIGHYATFAKYSDAILHMRDDAFLVLDEIHYAKNKDGLWGKEISKIGESYKYGLLLTGTPAPNGEEDIYNIIRIAFGTEFLNYFISSEDKEKIITNVHMKITFEDLKMKFKQIDNRIKFDLTEEQKRNLIELKKGFDKGGLLLLDYLQKRMMTISAPLKYEEFSEENSPKTKKLIEIINAEENTVIWTNWKRSGNSLLRILKNKYPSTNIYLYNGDKTSEQREQIISDYKKFGGWLIANPQTLAEAVSLHKHTDKTIYFEYSYNLVHWMQSRNRTFRVGMDKDMHYDILMERENGLSSHIIDRLSDKEIYQDSLMNFSDKNQQEMFKEDMINFLDGRLY